MACNSQKKGFLAQVSSGDCLAEGLHEEESEDQEAAQEVLDWSGPQKVYAEDLHLQGERLHPYVIQHGLDQCEELLDAQY